VVSPPSVVVVFGWAVFNAVLVGILPVFGATATAIGLYAAAVGLVTGFGAVAALAAARGRAGQQLRQPTRSGTAFLLAAAALLVGLGAVYHWWIALVAVYPLAGALALRAGERLAPEQAAPAPATTRTCPAPVHRPGEPLPYVGSPLGTRVAVPVHHPTRAAAPPALPTRPRAGRLAVAVPVLRAVFRALFRALFRVAASRRARRGNRGEPS
jgi:hypothetical protein